MTLALQSFQGCIQWVRRRRLLLVAPVLVGILQLLGGSFVPGGATPCSRMERWGRRTALRSQAEEVEDVEDDLDSDPNWRKVREEMVRVWNIRHEDDEWLVADDVKEIMDEHLQSVVGRAYYLDMEEAFVELADDEPRPGEISREDFAEIAGAYVFSTLYEE
ncbi:unnamed protein product [Effrenium voratum]|nr:unnamed protein product [Effrenium voratum]